MNQRNWETLLVATLIRARDHLPGPGVTGEDLEEMDTPTRHAAEVGIDIDDLVEMADKRRDDG